MATIKELQEKIAKLEKGINSKATSTNAKVKMRSQVKKFKNDIADLKATKKPTSSKVSKAKEIAKKLKAKYDKSRPFGGSNIEQDAERPAKPIGKRKSKYGNTYYEYRENRTDRKQPPKKYPRLEDGGMMAKDGKLDVGVYRVGKPKRVSPNLYEQKIVEIFENGDISTASDYGRKLSDFKSQKYPIITNERLEEQYKMADGGMMAKGGRTAKDFNGRVTKEKYGKYNLSEMYENNLDLIADVVDYIKDLQKEAGQSYAKDFVYDMMDVLKNGEIRFNDGATLKFADGGALDLLADTSGATSYDIGGTSFSTVDLTSHLDFNANPMFARGGDIKNQYLDSNGKTNRNRSAKNIWESWLDKQRNHFLKDHFDFPAEDYSKKEWDELPNFIQFEVKKHISMGQYAHGGETHRMEGGDEMYAKGGKLGLNTYKLRAEGLDDFLSFLKTGMYMRMKSFTIEPIGVPDVVVSFVTDASLSEIKSKLKEVTDSHVMLETIKPINEYTGERFAKGGLIQHGLRIGDVVRTYSGNSIRVFNKFTNEEFDVDLNRGERIIRK